MTLVLTLRIPKREEHKPKKIEVKVNVINLRPNSFAARHGERSEGG